MTGLGQVGEIVFPAAVYGRLLAHARRKLRGEHLPGEETERKAYGLVGGCQRGRRIDVTHVFPLRRNLRYEPRYKAYVDRLMDEVGHSSETPFERRGWVADPGEVLRAEEVCGAGGGLVFGGYHMHRVPWSHDPRREECTELDTRLAERSGLWMLILSMVDPDHPLLRAFFEGRNDHEAAVRVLAPAGAADA